MSRKAILTETSAIAQSANNDAGPAKDRLESSVLSELWAIWRADPRVPSVRSRRQWAISRNAKPRLVDSWFLRRKAGAKKMGKPVSNESYDLPLDPPIMPKREPSVIPKTEPKLEVAFDLPSDDTLVYPLDASNSIDMEASSDTTLDAEDASIKLKRIKTPAYTEVPQQFGEWQHQFRPQTRLAHYYHYVAAPFEGTSSVVYHRGWEKQLNFVYAFGPANSVQGTADEYLSDCVPISVLNDMPHSRLDFAPDALLGLSAIPFLFRTPLNILPNSSASHETVRDWTIVEEELGRLVVDGKLDFSFLDVPHLASMELPD